jgi:hypothetical protein
MNTESQVPKSKRTADKTVFWIVSCCQIAVLIAAFTGGLFKFGLVEKGGAYGISAFIFIVLYLPSLLLLIPDILFLVFSRKLSKGWRFFGYFFHTVAFSWSFFLVNFALRN